MEELQFHVLYSIRSIIIEIFFTQVECTMYLFSIISKMKNIIEIKNRGKKYNRDIRESLR